MISLKGRDHSKLAIQGASQKRCPLLGSLGAAMTPPERVLSTRSSGLAPYDTPFGTRASNPRQARSQVGNLPPSTRECAPPGADGAIHNVRRSIPHPPHLPATPQPCVARASFFCSTVFHNSSRELSTLAVSCKEEFFTSPYFLNSFWLDFFSPSLPVLKEPSMAFDLQSCWPILSPHLPLHLSSALHGCSLFSSLRCLFF